MDAESLYGFVEGPQFQADLDRIEVALEARDDLMFAIQNLLIERGAEDVSHPLGADTDIRYIRTREYPALAVPQSYVTFRWEREGLIELRRVVTEADVRAGLLADA